MSMTRTGTQIRDLSSRGRTGFTAWLRRLLQQRSVLRRVRTWGWGQSVARPAFTSTLQATALWPALVQTHPPIVGWLQGQDLVTHLPVTASPRGLYEAGMITTPGVLVAGDVGTAKSSQVKEAILRGIALGERWAVFDRKLQTDHGSHSGEYARLAQVVDGTVLRFDRDRRIGTRVNVLDPAIATTGADDSMVGQDELLVLVATEAKGDALTPRERWALTAAHRAALTQAQADSRIAVLGDVVRALYAPSRDAVPGPLAPDGQPVLTQNGLVDTTELTRWGLPLALALERLINGDLSGILDGETAGPDGRELDLSAPLLVMDTSSLPIDSTALGLVMAVMATFLMSRWVTVPGYKNIVVEEGYSADGLGSVPAMFRTLAKRSRGVGASMWSVFHHVSDVSPDSPLVSLIKETELAFIFRQSKPEDANTIVNLLGLPEPVTTQLMTLPRVTYLLHRGAKTAPTIVTQFRTSLEEWVTDTDQAMLSTPSLENEPNQEDADEGQAHSGSSVDG